LLGGWWEGWLLNVVESEVFNNAGDGLRGGKGPIQLVRKQEVAPSGSEVSLENTDTARSSRGR
jgi:hypothetical protein